MKPVEENYTLFPTATGFFFKTSKKPITNHKSKFNCEKKQEWAKAEFRKQINNLELSDQLCC